MDHNTVAYHLQDTVKFLIWATAIMGVVYTAGTFFYDRLLRKKAWLARQRQILKSLKGLLIKRRLARVKRG